MKQKNEAATRAFMSDGFAMFDTAEFLYVSGNRDTNSYARISGHGRSCL